LSPGHPERGKGHDQEAKEKIKEYAIFDFTLGKRAGNFAGGALRLSQPHVETGAGTIPLAPGLFLIPEEKIEGKDHAQQSENRQVNVKQGKEKKA
jgi:hypothetical protein